MIKQCKKVICDTNHLESFKAEKKLDVKGKKSVYQNSNTTPCDYIPNQLFRD